jgi:hypothetical protein
MTEPAPLTLKQSKWLKVYIETGNATEAAMQAYDCCSRESAAVLGHENIRKVKGAVTALMDAKGLTDDLLMKKLLEGLDANKTEFLKWDGEFKDSRDCVDFPTRQRYLDTAIKLKGVYAPDRQEISGPEGGPISILAELTDEQLDEIANAGDPDTDDNAPSGEGGEGA